MVTTHCSWRTLEEWRGMKLPLSTASNEASRMFDASLTQFVGYWEDASVGGISTTLPKMLQADPDFVMGYVLTNSLHLYGGGASVHNNPDLKESVRKMSTLCDRQVNLSVREKKHVKAVQLLADGYIVDACNVWEDILLEHPGDILALKCAYLGYIYLGDSAQLRDSVARILPHWKTSSPYYGFLLGMHAFGLEETNMYERAEKQARKALELNRHDCWSTHTLSHVLEMTGRQDQGIEFLTSTVSDWEGGKSLACHNYWHLALHHIEKGQYQEAVDIFDSQVCQALVSFREGDFANVVDLLHPLRYKIFVIGGSNAQRDVFNLLLIHAALKSPRVEHHRIARSMLAERKALKENSPLTDRLLGKVVALHWG
ncbi:hypothetical protein C0Q70_07807 [Pomacea canaliculata]|uniref:Tetratricopeptide repeat protein 38 n=1 Tax=Pomacea canaliculata TaxID=400727 RepID=A0A2T7PG27_POMCA|nr:hypothetical protein C0Q70_07807 [Pomacea canaliculata]